MNKKTALVFGGTGLTGSILIHHLNLDHRYEKVVIFTRRDIKFKSDKAEIINTDLSNIPDLSNHIVGDDLFCCLGTTLKKSASKDEYKNIERDIPAKVAEIANINAVPNYIVVSSIGANIKSRNLYLRIKGEMEVEVQKYGFEKIIILRPSIIFGPRNEFRFFEELGKSLARIFGFLFIGKFKKYRGINANTIAKAITSP